jgi:hypothetical protein
MMLPRRPHSSERRHTHLLDAADRGQYREVDVLFNQDMAMRIIRFRQVTQCGKAWPKPMHLRSRNSPLHEQ